MRRHVLMPFLVSRVFGDEVKVFATDDQGAVHFRGDDGAGEDATTNRDQTSEGTFLVWTLNSSAPDPSAKDAVIFGIERTNV